MSKVTSNIIQPFLSSTFLNPGTEACYHELHLMYQHRQSNSFLLDVPLSNKKRALKHISIVLVPNTINPSFSVYKLFREDETCNIIIT